MNILFLLPILIPLISFVNIHKNNITCIAFGLSDPNNLVLGKSIECIAGFCQLVVKQEPIRLCSGKQFLRISMPCRTIRRRGRNLFVSSSNATRFQSFPHTISFFKKKSGFLLLLLFGILLAGCGQVNSTHEPNSVYKPAQLRDDFKIFRGALKDFHPGLNWYLPEEEMDSLFASVYSSLDTPHTELNYFTKLATLVSAVRCGHLRIRPSKSTEDQIWGNTFFPLELRLVNKRAYCFQNYGNNTSFITPGNEVVKINGFAIDSLLELSNEKLSGDGFISTKKLKTFEKDFFIHFYPLHIGQPDSFAIEYIDGNGRNNKETMAALPLAEINRAKRVTQKQRSSDNLRLEFIDKATALLSVRSFNNWQRDNEEVDFEEELQSLFLKLDSAKAQNLVIDLRNNGGGEDRFGLNLFSYFYDQPVVEFSKMQFRSKSSDYFKYSDMSSLEWWFITSLYFDTHKVNDSTFLIAGERTLEPYGPSRPQFKGGVYILINGRSYSTTADFTALMKSYGLATFVGEETGGGYYGNTSWLPVNVALPHTQIRMKVPTVRYTTNVKPNVPFGRGTIPDYHLTPSIQDQLKGIDTELAFILELIEKSK